MSRVQSPTRGHGLFEKLLARKRAGLANRLIPAGLRQGSILDIGCGTRPYFLAHTSFQRRVGVDRVVRPENAGGIQLHHLDLRGRAALPFQTAEFDVVTMLAVIEHFDPETVLKLFVETHRILRPSGVVIITTPAPWADPLLRWMARCRLVSREEIEEHSFSYTAPILGWYFGRAGFEMERIEIGHFELGLNTWARCVR